MHRHVSLGRPLLSLLGRLDGSTLVVMLVFPCAIRKRGGLASVAKTDRVTAHPTPINLYARV